MMRHVRLSLYSAVKSATRPYRRFTGMRNTTKAFATRMARSPNNPLPNFGLLTVVTWFAVDILRAAVSDVDAHCPTRMTNLLQVFHFIPRVIHRRCRARSAFPKKETIRSEGCLAFEGACPDNMIKRYLRVISTLLRSGLIVLARVWMLSGCAAYG